MLTLSEINGIDVQNPPRSDFKRGRFTSASATQTGRVFTMKIDPHLPFLKVYGIIDFGDPSTINYVFRAQLLFLFKGQVRNKLPIEIVYSPVGESSLCALQRSSSNSAAMVADGILMDDEGVIRTLAVPRRLISCSDEMTLEVSKAQSLGSTYRTIFAVEQSNYPFV